DDGAHVAHRPERDRARRRARAGRAHRAAAAPGRVLAAPPGGAGWYRFRPAQPAARPSRARGVTDPPRVRAVRLSTVPPQPLLQRGAAGAASLAGAGPVDGATAELHRSPAPAPALAA